MSLIDTQLYLLWADWNYGSDERYFLGKPSLRQIEDFIEKNDFWDEDDNSDWSVGIKAVAREIKKGGRFRLGRTLYYLGEIDFEMGE